MKKTPRKRELTVFQQIMPRGRAPGPDLLLATLDRSLPAATVSKIIELQRQKIPRSEIARQLGISKFRVTHEIIKLGG